MKQLLTRRRFFGLSAVGALGYTGASNAAETVDVHGQLPGLKGTLRVLFVTDLHLPACLVSEDVVCAAAQQFQPHLVLIGGDTVTRHGNEGLLRWFASIPAGLGKFAILGNWEYKGCCRRKVLDREYERAGVQLLVNDVARLDHPDFGTLRLVGLDDLMEGDPQVELVVTSAPRATPALVLAHCPELYDWLPDVPLYCLSGHTHGGQIAPLGVVIYTPPGSGRYVRGAYPAGQRQLWVSRGLGNNGVPFRVGSRPEIVRLTLTGTATS